MVIMHAQTTVTLVSITLQIAAPVPVPRQVSRRFLRLNIPKLTSGVTQLKLSQLANSIASHNARP